MLGKNKKPKKNFKATALLHYHPITQTSLLLPSWSWTSLRSEPREGEEARGVEWPWGPASGSPPPLPVPGWVGCQVYLCTSCTLINLCKSPTPAPPCFCAFAHSPQAPRASLVPFPLAVGSGMDGPPRLESAGCPSHGTLASPQPVLSCSRPIRVS